jgi:hypothetical protein
MPIRSGSRPIVVRRPTSLAALIALALLAGCTGAEVPSPSTAAPSTVGPEPTSTSGAIPETTTPRPAEPGTPPTGATVWPTDEVPYDPIQRTVTGIVERNGGCTVLVVGTHRWALMGNLADSLEVGSRMTVTGNLTHQPPSCTTAAESELQVTRAVPA